MKAKVYVTYKPGVLDPQGQAVRQVLQRQGYKAVQDVRVGKMIEFDLEDVPRDEALDLLTNISDRLLANPVIESYRVEIP